jgi:hypothetical protein
MAEQPKATEERPVPSVRHKSRLIFSIVGDRGPHADQTRTHDDRAGIARRTGKG